MGLANWRFRVWVCRDGVSEMSSTSQRRRLQLYFFFRYNRKDEPTGTQWQVFSVS